MCLFILFPTWALTAISMPHFWLDLRARWRVARRPVGCRTRIPAGDGTPRVPGAPYADDEFGDAVPRSNSKIVIFKVKFAEPEAGSRGRWVTAAVGRHGLTCSAQRPRDSATAAPNTKQTAGDR